MNVLIIIPAYNESASIKKTVDELKRKLRYMSGHDNFDLLVIDDASEDNTFEVCSKIKDVLLTRNPINMGIGATVQVGFLYAIRKEYDYCFQVDADGQHDPSDILRMLKEIIHNKYDVVIGNRWNNSLKYTQHFRKIGNKLFGALLSFLIRNRIDDVTQGLRVYNKKAFQLMSRYYLTQYPDSPSIIVMHKLGLKLGQIPINFRKRIQGKSSITVDKSFIYPFINLLNLLRAYFSNYKND